MRGTFEDVGVALFDYTYTVGGGKNRSTVRQMVICFELDGFVLPTFSLQPENMLHKV